MSALAEVREAIEAGEWPRALDLALAAWRTRRFAELADLVDTVTARCEKAQPPHTRNRFATWWMTHARTYEPVIAGSLIEHASDRMFANELTWQAVQERWTTGNPVVAALIEANPFWLRGEAQHVYVPSWSARIAAMITWPHDPRVARLFTTWIVEGKLLDVAPRTVLNRLTDHIGELGDARSITRLRDIIDEPRGASTTVRNIQVELAHRALTRLGQTRGKDPPDDLLDEARTLVAAHASDAAKAEPIVATAALWREVIENPDAIEPRIVLGDALVQSGDTRGELIVLQCTPTDDEQRTRSEGRAAHLIKEGWSRWLGDLALVVTRKGSEFRRGLLESVRVGQTSTPEWAWAKVRRHRELAAVTSVAANHVEAARFARFVFDLPRFPRVLELNAPELIDELGRLLRRWPTTRVTYCQSTTSAPRRAQWPPLEATLTTLAAHAPELEHLELPPIQPWNAGVQVRDVLPMLPRMFPKLAKIRVSATSFRYVRDDPDVIERVRALPLVELYD